MSYYRHSWRPPTMKNRKIINDRMIRAIYTNNQKLLENCLKQGADPNYRIDDAFAPIHIATETGNYEMVSILLKYKHLKIDQYTDHYLTPLILACISNNKMILELLLKNGADPNGIDLCGRTPLLISTRFSFLDIIKTLIKYHANINIKDCFDNSPLSTSMIGKPDIKIARFLLENGANIDDPTKRLPLFFETIINTDCITRIDYVLLLLDYGIDVNYIDPFTGRNCLHYIAITGYYPLAVILINRGAKIDVYDRMLRTPLMMAQDHQHRPLIKLLKGRNTGSTFERHKIVFITAPLT